MKKIWLLILPLMLVVFNVKAAECSYEEQSKLNTVAAQVKANYELVEHKETEEYDDGEIEVYDVIYHTVKINITNITDSIYVIVNNKETGEKFTVTSTNVTDGVYSFDWANDNEIVTLSIEVYSTAKDGCESKKLRTILLKLPKKNPYYEYGVCDGVDLDICSEYITNDEMDYNSFVKTISSYLNPSGDKGDSVVVEENKSFFNKLMEHKILIISVVAGLAILGVGTFVIMPRIKRKRLDKKI